MRIYNFLFVLLATLFVACNTNNDTLPPPQQPPTQQQMALVAEFTVNDGDTIFTCTGFTNPLLGTDQRCENYKIFYINNKAPNYQKTVSVAIAVNTDSLEESPMTTNVVCVPFNFENKLEMSFKYWKQAKCYVNNNVDMANMISDIEYIGIVSQDVTIITENHGLTTVSPYTQTLSMRHFKVSGEMSCDFAEYGFPNNKVGAVTIEYNMSILLPR